MYIENLKLQHIRTFVNAELKFIHRNMRFCKSEEYESSAKKRGKLWPKPRLPNVTLLLGDNGSGKSTVLRTIAMAALGPAIEVIRVPDTALVRREEPPKKQQKGSIARRYEPGFSVRFLLHEQDHSRSKRADSDVRVTGIGELEKYTFKGDQEQWKPVYNTDNESFFVVGYGATRRTERPKNIDFGARAKSDFGRVQRVLGLFDDSYSLIPLGSWLPRLTRGNPGRYKQVVNLIDRLLRPSGYRFTGTHNKRGDYDFFRGDLRVPFHNLSDGYRGFIGWVADMLYHICFGCPKGKKLVESRGIVLVDEIDLHLHPKWQMEVIATVAKALPNIQFVFTSHSPLVASSLEWMNIQTLKATASTNTTRVKQFTESVHGLDADQMLLTDFFGLKSTMAAAKAEAIGEITARIHAGDPSASLDLIRQLSTGTEPSPDMLLSKPTPRHEARE